MERLPEILLLFVAAVLFFGITITADSADLNYDDDFRLGESQHQSTIYPVNKPDFVGVNRQAGSAIELVRIPPAPNLKKKNDEDSTNPGLLSEIPIRRSVSIYLCFSGTIHQSLSIKELLFPFHHFL